MSNCTYCGHPATQHRRTSPPGNGPVGNRCNKGCVCSGFCDTTVVTTKGEHLPVRSYHPAGARLIAKAQAAGCQVTSSRTP